MTSSDFASTANLSISNLTPNYFRLSTLSFRGHYKLVGVVSIDQSDHRRGSSTWRPERMFSIVANIYV